MEGSVLNRVRMFYQWSDQLSEVSNGGVLVLAVLLALFTLALLAVIFAAAEDEEKWKAEKEALMLENASLRGVVEGAQEVRVAQATQNWQKEREAFQNVAQPTGVAGRKEEKQMGTIKEARQMVREIGLLRALVMVTMAALLGKMLKTSWEQIKHHFGEENGQA